MSQPSQLDDSREQRLEQALAEYLRSVELGQPVDRGEILSRHPDLADELRLFFCNRDAMQDLARPLQDAAGKIAAGEELTIVQGSGDRTEQPAGPRVRYFGDYELLSEIARGGMGVVYKARQESLKRTVALKMILSGQLASAEDVSRFRQEAEAAANLDHPHIVPIYEIGEHDGQHYFSMKLIEGDNLAQLLSLKRAGLPFRRAARLVATVARAVHHAHQRGLLHRDLKPGNILIDADDQPQVTDFGLARRVEGDSDLTRSGTAVGTPSYMAPEQARAQKQLSTAADVYSLGAILYELLTGQPPFRGDSAVDTIMQVISHEPKRPRVLNPRMDRDLETICLKCLEKEPQRRYDSAAALADDLDRWARGEPILARPAGKLERTLKWARRHPSVASLAASLLVVCLVGFCLVTWKWREASRRADAETQALEASRQSLERSRQLAFTAQLWRAAGLIGNDPASAVKALDNIEVCPIDRRDFAWRYYRRLSHRVVRRFSLADRGIHDESISPDGEFVAAKALVRSTVSSLAAAISSDGALLAAVTPRGEIRLFDVATGKPEGTLPGHGDPFQSLAFSPDGKTLATGGADGLVRLWDLPERKLAVTLTWQFPDGVPRWVMSLAFSHDGRSLAAGGGFFDSKLASLDTADSDAMWRKPVVWVWDVRSSIGNLLTAEPRLKGRYIEESGVSSLAYSPDDKNLAIGLTRESSVLLLNAATGDETQRFRTEGGWIEDLAFSPDGTSLAFGNSTSNVFICDVVARKVRHTLRGHLYSVGLIRFTPNGALISGSYDGSVRIWDAAAGELRTTLDCEAPIRTVGLLPGGKQLLVVNSREAQVWSLGVQAWQARLRAPKLKDVDDGSTALAFDEESSRLAVVGQDELVRVWNVARRTLMCELVGHKGRTTAVAFGPKTSDLLVSGGEDHRVVLWRLRSSDSAEPTVLAGHSGEVTCLTVTPDAALVVSGSLDGTVRLWDPAAGKLVHTIVTNDGPTRTLALSADGKRLITGGQDGSLRIWDMAERRLVETLPSRWKAPIDQLALTRDGRTAATVQSHTVALYDLQGPREARQQSQISGALVVAFTPDGKTLAVGGTDRIVRLYDVASGHLRAELPGHTHQVMSLAFNRDATLLATASRGWLHWDHRGEVLLWQAPLPEKNGQ